ncbi:preprotein translocase subunit SecG [Entomoplasma freundtii]|uniref:Protein-export membrane protein SecG n=1 Tax=Entomoplasma freundtii TaxID=74700 RepID=A0A2K8NVJ5_9MOLU|nr:preprotein translocase subunit SecG [Entomoplasma freundtii]ATZ16653.1 preprotein translocase subunit SecG [Entomoplasma freundtii]TDY58180.1 preprotein translocase subunit SecG [Entomoplasma freundtii]
MKDFVMTLLASDKTSNATGNRIIFIFEIIMMVVSVGMIIIGLLQNKKSQTGLSALNGGNEELFSNSKERGADRTFSIWMLSLGIAFFVATIIICILTNTILK